MIRRHVRSYRGDTVLTVSDLHKSFGDSEILRGIDIEIEKGEVIAVIGPSGSGKTTMLRCISFLEKADSGRMEFKCCDDEAKVETYDMHHASPAEIRRIRRHMGFVFQSFNLFQNRTALGNVMEGLVTGLKRKKSEAEEISRKMLAKVGLAERADYYPGELSGGQQQRVAIARALALDPDIMLFDEPTSALDPELTREVLDTIRELASEGTTMLVVTHEMNFAREVAGRVLFMEDGVIVEQGAPAQIFDAPEQERTREFLRRAK